MTKELNVSKINHDLTVIEDKIKEIKGLIGKADEAIKNNDSDNVYTNPNENISVQDEKPGTLRTKSAQDKSNK